MEEKKMTRKSFLRLGGSLVAGGVIAGTSGSLLWKMIRQPDDVFFDAEGEGYKISDGDTSISPYRKEASWPVDGEIEAFELAENQFITAAEGTLVVRDLQGREQAAFAVGDNIRDLALLAGELYVLFPARIEVYDLQGRSLRGWDACSDESDYCSMTASPAGVYVTDAAAKNICHYRLDGTMVRFIDSPNGFVVPSYSFAITHDGGILYCSNPGRHLVESYTEDGEYLAAFGTAGTAPGKFSGCCNPVQLTVSPAGELLASEKGIPRISCWSKKGEFRSILLNQKALGGGHDASEVRMLADGRLLVAGHRAVSLYRYDSRLAQVAAGESISAACALCGIDCPVKKGVTI